jgi:hypothetical protein
VRNLCDLRHVVFARPDLNDTREVKTKTGVARMSRVPCMSPFAGIIRFRFQGFGGRSRRNLSPPRKTPLQAWAMQRIPGQGVKQFENFKRDSHPTRGLHGIPD